ncbi:kinase-like domain-containing protein [Rhizophagus clarus]|nr:kinase-like domain-containing protein [Rhizophagus clarus]
MYSVKDVQSFQFAKDIIALEDVFNVSYLGYLMVKCEQYVITLNSTKLSKEFKQAAENAIESMNPFESLKPYLDCFDVTHFFKDDDGKVTTIEAECLQNLSNYTDDNLGIVEFDNVISTHNLLDMEQQNKIDTILNVKDNYKIIMTGIDDLKELEITKNNRYGKEIYTKVVFEETNFKFFGSIISKDNSKVEDYFVMFFMNSHNGFFVSITPLSESSIDIRKCYVLWMIVGIPSKVNVFSPRNRELHVNYIIKEQNEFRLNDDDSYYPIKTSFQLTKGDTVFVNTYFPVIGYGLKFVNWSKDFIYLRLFKDHIASKDNYYTRTPIIDVHICVLPYKVLKLDNSNEEY